MIKFEDLPEIEGMKIVNIEGEKWREYIYETGAQLKIEFPFALYLPIEKGTKGHRVVGRCGEVVWVRPNFMAIRWKKEDNLPPLDF